MCSWAVTQVPGICIGGAFSGNEDSMQEPDHAQEDLGGTHSRLDLGEACLCEEDSTAAKHCAQELQDASRDDSDCEAGVLHVEPGERSSQKSPTWSTFNSLTSDKKPKMACWD